LENDIDKLQYRNYSSEAAPHFRLYIKVAQRNADRYRQSDLRALMKIAYVIHGLYYDVRVDMSGAEGFMHWKGILVILRASMQIFAMR
jgi:hypothetical protein